MFRENKNIGASNKSKKQLDANFDYLSLVECLDTFSELSFSDSLENEFVEILMGYYYKIINWDIN